MSILSKRLFTIPNKSSSALYLMKKDNSDIEFKLISKQKLNHDSFIFRFEIPIKNTPLGTDVSEHVTISSIPNPELKEMVIRKYTPITPITQTEYFDILIKIYFKNTHVNFPNGGIMTQYLYDLPINSMVKFNGPFGKQRYLGDGRFEFNNGKTRDFSKIVFLAGGTGIAPVFSVSLYLYNMFYI